MLRDARVQRLLVVAACAVLGVYEGWTVFVRETPALAIQGRHVRSAYEFGQGERVSQGFEMIGNGFTALDVQLMTEGTATVLIACELLRIDPNRPDAPITERAWSVPVKRVSGVQWRRITFPPLTNSNAQIYYLQLRLIGVIEGEQTLAALMRVPSREHPLPVALVVSRENILGGGSLWIGDQRQLGSLSLRAFTHRRTAYERFQADVAPTLPAALRNPAVELVMAIAYQWALLMILRALVMGDGTTRGQHT
jgi:hypothetical protein